MITKWTLVFSLSFTLLQPALSCAQTPDFRANQEAVTHTFTVNQGQAGFCWAYALSSFIEGEAKKNQENVIISPEYLGFYNMYFQLQKHLNWFKTAARKIHTDSNSSQQETQDAYERIYLRDRFFKPDEGADELKALQQLEVSGVVPQKAFKFKLPSDIQEQRFTDAIKNFIKTHMFDEQKLSQYESLNENGINTELFTGLSQALGISPPQPGDSFDYLGKSYTPKTFMSDYLRFNPGIYKQISVSARKTPQALNLIREVMKKNVAVPVGFTVFQDQAAGAPKSAQELAVDNGDFSTRFCPGNRCRKVDGGHEVLGVNWTEDSNGDVNSLVIKNSWGRSGGRNDRGVETQISSETGFYILEVDYLKDSGTWNFIVPVDEAADF
jgi:hypothetical protein